MGGIGRGCARKGEWLEVDRGGVVVEVGRWTGWDEWWSSVEGIGEALEGTPHGGCGHSITQVDWLLGSRRRQPR